MKKYIAIGHWRDSKNITCVASTQNTMKDFRNDLINNEFVAYVVLTEKKFETVKNATSLELFKEVQKLTSNYHVWENVTDYIKECLDIIEEKMARA